MLSEWFHSIKPFLSQNEMDRLNRLQSNIYWSPETHTFPMKNWVFAFQYEMVKKYYTLSPRYIRKNNGT